MPLYTLPYSFPCSPEKAIPEYGYSSFTLRFFIYAYINKTNVLFCILQFCGDVYIVWQLAFLIHLFLRFIRVDLALVYHFNRSLVLQLIS